jgi:hypothetical protein
MLDRTAALVLGLVAGFVVGSAFESHPADTNEPPRAVAPVQPPPVMPAEPATAPMPDKAAIDPRVISRVRSAGGRVRIGVFGDSFGNGLWEALYRQLPMDDGYDVLRFSKEATGFTRSHALDVGMRAKEQVARDPIDVAVISFGANDAQPLYIDGRLHPLMDPTWQREIGARIDRFVGAARATGASVYWIGLPVMRDPSMDADMRSMDDFYARHMRALGVSFVETRPLSVDAQGRYDAYLPDADGVPRLMRTLDGLHMMGIGYQRLTQGVAGDIRAYAARIRRAAGLAASSGAAR